MSQQSKSRTYEDNYTILERITESLNKDEIGIDDLVEKTKEALGAARTCMDILNKQKGEFQKLETEFSQLLKQSQEEPDTKSSPPPAAPPSDSSPPEAPPAPPNPEYRDNVGQDDPF